MKPCHTCFLPFLFIVFIGCENSSPKKKAVNKAAPTNDTITTTVNKLKTRAELYLRYQDDKGNDMHYPYDKNSDKQVTQKIVTKTPLIINDDDVLGNGTRYVLLTGDVVNVNDGTADKLFKFTTNDTIRNNELDFFPALQRNLRNFNYYKISQFIKVGGRLNQVFKEMYIYYKSPDLKFATTYTNTKYNEQLSFLNEYAKKHAISLKMKKVFEDMIYFDYASRKLRIALLLVEKHQAKDSQTLTDINTFKNKISQGDYLYIPEFRLSLINYLSYLRSTSNAKNGTVYSLIKQNFNGDAKDYLLFYAVNKAVMEKKYDQQLLQAFYHDCKNPDYILEIRKDLAMVAPGEQATLLDNKGNKTTFEDLIRQNKNEVVYVDFWASWCAPCMAQMAPSAVLHKSLENYPIRFLYLSMDNSYSAWQSASIQLKHDNAANFLVANNFQSTLAKRFHITTIPRYLIINKAGNIITADASEPSDKATKTTLLNLAK